MEESETDQRKAAWSAYWADGTLHSLPGSFSGNYAGAFERFWLDIFRLLPADSCVLDIATGNGALPKMLLDTADRPPMRIDAIDAAELTPGWIAQSTPEVRARLHFHARTPAEALPFADATFDLCTSQYGIEYSHLQQSVPQALRVTKAGGLIAWVLHHHESRPVQLAIEDRAHCAWLLGTEGPFEAALAVALPAAQSGSSDARTVLQQSSAAEQLRLQFNAAMDRLSKRAAAAGAADTLHRCARAVMQVLQQARTTGPAEARKRLQGIQQALLHGLHRNDDLLAHAPKPDTIASIEATIVSTRPDWSVMHRPISLDSGLVGQALIAGKTDVLAPLRK